jgi:zinc/manganese transport system substrate-binding protein
MGRILAGALLASTLLAPSAHATLNVVATTPDLAALAREIGGSAVTITTLAKPTEDPHFVDAKPSFVTRLNRADVLIEGGAELESGWLAPLLQSGRNPRLASQAPGRVSAVQGVRLLDIPTSLDRAQGHVHGAGNPHFLTDPGNALVAAEHICAAFCALEPSECESYQSNLEKFRKRIGLKLPEWKARLAPFQGARVAAFHNTWPYFAHQFGLRCDLFLEPKPGIPPTASHLASAVTAMKSDDVRIVLVEPYQNRRTAEKVAREAGAVVVEVTQYPGGVKGTEAGYIEMLDYVVNAVARGLETAH